MKALLALWIAAALCCGIGAAHAQAPVPAAETPESALAAGDERPPSALEAELAQSLAAQDDARLGAFVDGVVEAHRRRDDVAGVIVAIVQRGRVRLARGYGYTSMDPLTATDPQRSAFRIGSISKTFTYVLIQQLIEQGRMDLDTPINSLLPAELAIADEGYDPILLRHLLTHSAGFEDTALGHIFERRAEDVLTPEQYLIRHRPARVRPTGAEANYSNYGVALLGAIIAHAHQRPYLDVVEQQLLAPLQMRHSTMREPLAAGDPRALPTPDPYAISAGFSVVGGRWQAQDFEFISHASASGGMSASAADMARWMLMHLAGGTLDGARILSTESLAALHEDLFRNAPGVPAIGRGYLTDRVGRYAAYGHGGTTLYSHSRMWIYPELDLGVFISSNTETGRALVDALPARVIEFLDPTAVPTVVSAAGGAGTDLNAYAGMYLSNRRPYTGVEQLLMSMGGISVVSVEDGALVVSGGESTTRFLPQTDGSFREWDGHRQIDFRRDAAGQPVSMASSVGIAMADRLPAWRSPNLLFGMLLLLFVLSVLSLRALWRRRDRRPAPRPDLAVASIVESLCALGWLAFLIVFAVALGQAAAGGNAIVFDYPGLWLNLSLTALWPLAVLSLCLAMLWLPVLRSRWRFGAKSFYSLFLLSQLALLLSFWSWGLFDGAY